MKRLLSAIGCIVVIVFLLSCKENLSQTDLANAIPATTENTRQTQEPMPEPKPEATPEPTPEPTPPDLSRFEEPMLAMQDVLREYYAGNLTRQNGTPAPTPELLAYDATKTGEGDFDSEDNFLSWSYWGQSYTYASRQWDVRGYDEALIPEGWSGTTFELAPGRVENGNRVLYPKPVQFYDRIEPDTTFMWGGGYDGRHCVPEEFGYALLDLDKDKEPELILLATMNPVIRHEWEGDEIISEYIEQDEPYWIFGIYTIKNEQLLCSLSNFANAFFRLGKDCKIYGHALIQFDYEEMRLRMRNSDGALIAEEYYIEYHDFETESMYRALVDSKGRLHQMNESRDFEGYAKYTDWSRINFVSIGEWIVMGERDYAEWDFDCAYANGEPLDYFVSNDYWRPDYAGVLQG